LVDAAGQESQTEGALQHAAAHRFGRDDGTRPTMSLRGKEQDRMAVRFPLLAPEQQGAFVQSDVAILIAFAGADGFKNPQNPWISSVLSQLITTGDYCLLPPVFKFITSLSML